MVVTVWCVEERGGGDRVVCVEGGGDRVVCAEGRG